jgi:hypothetical protein
MFYRYQKTLRERRLLPPEALAELDRMDAEIRR